MTDTTKEFDLLGSELESTFGDGAVAPEPETPPAEPPTEEPAGEGTDDKSQGDDAPAEGTPGEKEPEGTEDGVDDSKKGDGDDPDDAADKGAAAEAPAGTDEPEEKQVTKEDVAAAIRESQKEQADSQAMRTQLRDEARSAFYPEGVEKPIVDSDNNPINGAHDMVGKIINPETNEPFTYDEARVWWDRAKSEQDRRIEEAEQYIDAVAETNQSLVEGEAIVMAKYGAMLSQPEYQDVAKRAYEGYQRILVKDKKTGIVIKAPMSVVEYYDLVMQPYLTVSQQKQAASSQEEAQKQQETQRKQAAAEKADRADLPQKGTPGAKDKKDALDNAFDEYFEG